PVVKYAENTDIIVTFLSMHDSSLFDTIASSRNIINKFNEYLKIFGKKNENGKGYKTKIIFISMWATDPTSRDKGYQL
ncbi:hypothetical protein OFO29_44880, partial [Escherichia coli]|nr:hypothetical protein [Escherichia coli]